CRSLRPRRLSPAAIRRDSKVPLRDGDYSFHDSSIQGCRAGCEAGSDWDARRAEGCPNREFTARAAPWARRISCFPAYQLLTNHADTAEFPSSSTTGFGLCHRRGWGRSGPTLQGHRLEHIEGFAQGVVLRGTRGRARLRLRDVVWRGLAFA